MNSTASASAPQGRIPGADPNVVGVLEFSNDRCPLARSASPLFPASVSARPASGLAPVVGMNVTNGLTDNSDCCAWTADGMTIPAIETTVAITRNEDDLTTMAPGGMNARR